MKFSVIMPCYNAERYVAQAIESVIQQSYPDWELIIIDDGSVDSSAAIALHYQQQDQRIKLIQQPNAGKPAITRNRGIQAARGQLLCFLDADDRYHPSRFEHVAQCFLQQSVDFIFHDYRLIDEHNHVTEQSAMRTKLPTEAVFNQLFTASGSFLYLAEDLYNFYLMHACLIHTSSITIRRDRFAPTTLQFRTDLTCAEDLMLWYQLSAEGTAGYIDQALSDYRDTPLSITKNVGRLDEDSALFYQLILQHPHQPLSTAAKVKLKQRIQDNLLSAAYQYSVNGNKAHALSIYLAAFKQSASPRILLQMFRCLFRPNRLKTIQQ